MKEIFVIFAKYNADANSKMLKILNGMSDTDRDADRGSYYKSINGLVKHITSCTAMFVGKLSTVLAGNSRANDAASAVSGITKDAVEKADWKSLSELCKTADNALIEFSESLEEGDFKKTMTWFSGAQVPLSSVLQAVAAHNTHHRGQVSQILDSLKIDNDWSGIDAAFLK